MDAKSNRDVRERVMVKKTILGRGVFASQEFLTDSIIGEIDGQVMDADFESDYCIDLDGVAGMEPLPPFRFLNHSCEPNCELVLWKRRKESGKEIPRVWLVAIKNVRVGEELTIDYGWPSEDAVACLCGSKQCRGWVVEADNPATLSVT